MAAPLYRQPTRSEIIDLAAQESHDADIPSNNGSIPREAPYDSAGTKKHATVTSEKDHEKDIEKGPPSRPLSSNDEEGTGEIPEDEDPNIVFWDGPNDPENPYEQRIITS